MSTYDEYVDISFKKNTNKYQILLSVTHLLRAACATVAGTTTPAATTTGTMILGTFDRFTLPACPTRCCKAFLCRAEDDCNENPELEVEHADRAKLRELLNLLPIATAFYSQHSGVDCCSCLSSCCIVYLST